MTDIGNESEEDIADDVLPVVVDEPAVPMALDALQAWHRPRKQVIREKQWLRNSRELINRIKGTPALRPDSDGIYEVRYLTLPGIDYLDVRELADVCREQGCAMTSTGFLAEKEKSPVQARAAFREDALIKAGHITDRSNTYNQRFEDICAVSSQAYLELRNRAPFHIINIDACGSIALPDANHPHRLVDAIYRTIELQLELCTNRWLLFFTADVCQDSIAGNTIENLCEAIFQNARKNDAFRVGASVLLASEDKEIQAAVKSAIDGGGRHFLDLFSLGFAKWLLHLAEEKQWSVKMHKSYCYSTLPKGQNDPTMPCLAFEFVPPPRGLADPFNVTNAHPAPGGVGEDMSMRALTKVSELLDLDQLLETDHRLRTEMINKTRILLDEAGYAASVLEQLETFGNPPAG